MDFSQGLHMGFISESEAANVDFIVPVPFAGNQAVILSTLLPGGEGNCSSGDDREVGPDGQTIGWWIYFNSTSDLIETQ